MIDQLTNKQLKEIKDTQDEWHYVKLSDFYPQLNRLLLTEEIQQAYHDATFAYWESRRFYSIRNYRLNHVMDEATPSKDNKYIVPYDYNTCDWDWEIVGRRPKYRDFTCHSACHWLTQANQLLATRLFPEINWSVVSSNAHSSVISLDSKLIFDLNYFAMSVSVTDALTGLFGSEFNDEYDHELYLDGSSYDYKGGNTSTGLIMKFWDQVRELNSSDEHVINAIRFIDDPDCDEAKDVKEVRDTIVYDTTYGTEPEEMLTLVEA